MLTIQKQSELRQEAQALADRLYGSEVVVASAIVREKASSLSEEVELRDYFEQEVVAALSQHAVRTQVDNQLRVRTQYAG